MGGGVVVFLSKNISLKVLSDKDNMQRKKTSQRRAQMLVPKAKIGSAQPQHETVLTAV